MNHPRRRIAAGGLLLAVAALAVAVAVQFWHRSTVDEQVAMATPAPAASAPASGPLPAAVSSPDAGPVPAETPTPAVAASMASSAASEVRASEVPAFKPPTVQDFGQIVLIGMHGGTPKQAGEAAYILQSCLEFSLVDLSGLARRSTLPEAERHARIAAAEWLEGQCASITPDMQAQRGALAGRAVEAGIPGVALVYGRSVGYRPPEAMRQPLLEAMKTDFRDGDRRIVDELAFNGMKLGLTQAESRAYLLVSISEAEGEARRVRELAMSEGPLKDVSEDDIRESEVIAERLKRERKPPKRRNG